MKPWKVSNICKLRIVFICFNLWSIWLHRNDIHFNEVEFSYATILTAASANQESWKLISNKSCKRKVPDIPLSRIRATPNLYTNIFRLGRYCPCTSQQYVKILIGSSLTSSHTWQCQISDNNNRVLFNFMCKTGLHNVDIVSNPLVTAVLESVIFSLLLCKNLDTTHIIIVMDYVFSQVWVRFRSQVMRNKD